MGGRLVRAADAMSALNGDRHHFVFLRRSPDWDGSAQCMWASSGSTEYIDVGWRARPRCKAAGTNQRR